MTIICGSNRGFPCVQFLFRLALAATFAIQAATVLIVPSFTAEAASIFSSINTANIADVLSNALLLIVSIWLFFGVRTRVVALLGGALFVALLMTERLAIVETDAGRVLTVAVLSLALPLVVFGGGRFAVYARGWRNVL